MKDLKISEMMSQQRELWEKYKDKWSPMEPPYGRDSILWMIEELGEVIAIIKKRGETAIMEDVKVRSAFVEEFADVLMYLTDAMLRYGVTPDEISSAYVSKHNKNMVRDFDREHSRYLK
ncbi:MAG TPA: nucleotide pyrophosphohydrolase [Clostridiaceae bacterium]|nr:nucleotide pyrophosphohydrolase [Clostridiaceae bacterium]